MIGKPSNSVFLQITSRWSPKLWPQSSDKVSSGSAHGQARAYSPKGLLQRYFTELESINSITEIAVSDGHGLVSARHG